jgi:hypothetical protein
MDIRSMKPQTEKLSKPKMRFFTRELYIQFNSPDEDEADRADEAWEKALQAYQRHLESLNEKMPEQVRKLAGLCLHDAEVLAEKLNIEPVASPPTEPSWPGPLWWAVCILTVEQEGKMLSLIYSLWDHVREYAPPGDWPFSKIHKHWLYDEVDSVGGSQGLFLHRVLFSDGKIAEIPFVSVIMHTVTLPASKVVKKSRKTA